MYGQVGTHVEPSAPSSWPLPQQERIRQEVPHLVSLGVQVVAPFGAIGCDDGDLVDHFQVVAVVNERVGLLRIVRQEPDPGKAQVLEDLKADAIVARVGAVTQGRVRLDGIEPLVLEIIGADLLDQADPPPLLGQVDECADPLGADHLQGHAELVAAVAPQRIEQVAREAGGVQPHQGRFDGAQVAHDDRDRLVARFVLHAIADDPAAPVNGGQVRLGDALHELLAEASVLDQGLDRDDRQAVLAGDLVQPLAPGHLDPIGDLAEDAGGCQAGQPGQVHGRLGMPGAAEHAALLGHQGKEVAGTDAAPRASWLGR